MLKSSVNGFDRFKTKRNYPVNTISFSYRKKINSYQKRNN